MGEILVAGTTHFPHLLWPDNKWTSFHDAHLASPKLSAEAKDPRNWPAPMREEWGENGANAMASAASHRTWMVERFRRIRNEIDAFKPDFVLIWGDDQYENFQEDLVPPFSIFIMDQFESTPFARHYDRGYGNFWNLPREHKYVTKGHSNGARFLTTRLLEMGYPIPYGYKGLHHPGLAHAFINTILYLDYDNRGEKWPYPILPFHVNCYGSSVVRNRGFFAINAAESSLPDPPAPSAKLCYDIGVATARALKESPWRVCIIGSSSWSHAFLTHKNNLLWPDVEADTERFNELKSGRQHLWQNLTMKQIEESGQQELLNWICLAGAMDELKAKPDFVEMTASYIFNSPKVMMIARPTV